MRAIAHGSKPEVNLSGDVSLSQDQIVSEMRAFREAWSQAKHEIRIDVPQAPQPAVSVNVPAPLIEIKNVAQVPENALRIDVHSDMRSAILWASLIVLMGQIANTIFLLFWRVGV